MTENIVEERDGVKMVAYPVRPYRVEAYCSNDGSVLKSTGIVYSTYPPMYPYACPTCDNRVTLGKDYPAIEYR